MSIDLATLHARYDHDITYCMHAHDRAHQAARTLAENLAQLRDYPRVGMVVFDYNSSDALPELVRSSYQNDIERGRLLYARERTTRYFHASKSKNIAHRLGPGRLLVNLDADNFIGKSIEFVLQMAAASDRLLLHMWSGVWEDGTYGRIAISRELFHELRGYDEAFLPMGHEDTDLILRARLVGADVVSVTGNHFRDDSSLRVSAIPNTRAESIEHTGSRLGYEVMNQLNTWRSRVARRVRGPQANPRGWGRATVEVNFSAELVLP